MFAIIVKQTRTLCSGFACIRISKDVGKKAFFSTFTRPGFYFERYNGIAGSLNTKFIKYIAMGNCKYDQLIPQKIRYSEFYPIHNPKDFSNQLNNIELNQMARLIVFTYTYKSNADPQKFIQALNEIDSVCTNNLSKLDYDEILNILYSFMYLMPNKIINLNFYRPSLKRLVQEFEISMAKEKFVQICFYLGLPKRSNQNLLKEFMDKHLEMYLNDLNTTDLAIVGNAAFKTSTIIQNNLFNSKLINEILNIDPKEDSLLVTFIKSLRLNRIQSVEIYEKLRNLNNSKQLDKFQFKGLVHIFAYYSAGLWNEPNICKEFIEKCLRCLDNYGNIERHYDSDIRCKDLATFLWCCSNLKTDYLTENDLNFIEGIILKKYDENEYKYCSDDLIDSVLSMWMLDYKSKVLFECVQGLNVNTKYGNSERVKLDSRKKLLINCIQIEKPEWLSSNKERNTKVFQEDRPAPKYLVKNHKSLDVVINILKENQSQFHIKALQLVSPINEINVAGILIEFDDNRKCYLEVLENNQILKFDEKPIAIVDLKVKLLQYLGYNCIMIKVDGNQTQEILLELKEKFESISTTNNLEILAV